MLGDGDGLRHFLRKVTTKGFASPPVTPRETKSSSPGLHQGEGGGKGPAASRRCSLCAGHGRRAGPGRLGRAVRPSAACLCGTDSVPLASGPDKRQPRGMRVSVVSCHTERWDSPAAGRAAARRAGPSPAPAHRGPHGPRGRDAGGRPCLSVQDLPGNGFSPGRCLQLGTGCSAPPAPY